MILAKCTFHRDLANDTSKVKGGGMFRYQGDDTFLLFGSSFDFGAAKLEDIKKCIEDGKVYGNSGLRRSLSNYRFIYDTQTELIALN